jgi:hypothetical protein
MGKATIEAMEAAARLTAVRVNPPFQRVEFDSGDRQLGQQRPLVIAIPFD